MHVGEKVITKAKCLGGGTRYGRTGAHAPLVLAEGFTRARAVGLAVLSRVQGTRKIPVFTQPEGGALLRWLSFHVGIGLRVSDNVLYVAFFWVLSGWRR